MSTSVDLKGNPFYLDDEAIKWVEDTLASMTEDEKVQQLFFPAMYNFGEDNIDAVLDVLEPAGFMYRPVPAKTCIETSNYLNKKCKVPPLIAANLEKGGNGIVDEGTLVGTPMAVAATDNIENARRLGTLCAREGKAVGANWAFAPIIDIDYNFRNPIMNLRTFGSDPERVASFGEAYTRAVQAEGMAACIKHFPGDGRDERDQHLVVNVNDMECEEWMETYGECYKRSIEAGALTAMAGHIMLPSWQRRINPDLKDEDMLPATLSPELIGKDGLLRKELGFNGLIATDATTMAGFMTLMERRKSVPWSIAAGADVFLFNRNLKEDLEYMRAGVAEGIITRERLDEAITRILALKAALGLHKPQEPLKLEDTMKVLSCEEHIAWTKEIYDNAITLVKEEKGVLPLDPKKKRVLYCPIQEQVGYTGSAYSVKAGICEQVAAMLEKEGFEVTTFEPSPLHEGATPRCDSFTNSYDYIIYVANMSTKSNQTTVRIEWQQPMGSNCPSYVTCVPTIFISVENPYHLLDVPRVKTYINVYGATDISLEALMDKLMGRSEFKGKAPSDVFCGRWDTHL